MRIGNFLLASQVQSLLSENLVSENDITCISKFQFADFTFVANKTIRKWILWKVMIKVRIVKTSFLKCT